MLRRLHCQGLRKLGSAAGPREAAMGSGRVQNRFNIVPKWVPRSSLEPPGRVLGGLENRFPKGTKSNPEGTKMASWRPPGGFWAPGVPQMAAQAALRPHVGGSCGPLAGSWGRLGEPLAPLGALLGLPGGSPEARGGAPGGARDLGKSQGVDMFNGLVASTVGVVFGRLLPFLWRARRWRVP